MTGHQNLDVYLNDIPLPEAKARLKQALLNSGLWKVLGTDEVPLEEHLCGRVLAEPVWALISSPHYHSSAMDGFAVRSADTGDALPNSPVKLTSTKTPETGGAIYLDTGDPLPPWFDAVIPIELIEPLDLDDRPAKDPRNPDFIRVRASVPPWSNVRVIGEDIVATQLVLPAGHVLRPVDLGAIAACGHSTVCVARKPRIAILPTGSELVKVGHDVEAGKIIEFNSMMLAAQIEEWGGKSTRFDITPDDFNQIRQKVAQAAQGHDLVLLNAGSSAGSEDFSAKVIESLGTILVHGIAVRPGHPVILGLLDRQIVNELMGSNNDKNQADIPIVGVPGYPVSAALTGEIFIEPLLALWLGRKEYAPEEIVAHLTRKITSPPGDDDYLRVMVGRVKEKVLAAPLARGSGVISSLVRADGIVVLPRGVQGLDAGSEVRVKLYKPIVELKQTIFVIGSHDIILDLLSQHLAGKDRRIASANVGSQAGLVALARGESHMAGSHLLDPETGEYNLKYIRQYLSGINVKVLDFVERQQGLLVLPGNPKAIYSLEDLIRPEIHYLNRQRGAGTRVLFDYQLMRLKINPSQIRGYHNEEYTHLSVAAAISSGRADCGLGIAAAAQALHLDFVPLYQEKYQLIIPAEFYEGELLQPLFETLQEPAFRKEVLSLAGYDISSMGNLIAEL